MNKYITTLLVAVVSLMCFSLRASATIYEVSTADEFMTHWAANDSIQLTADIDLSGFTTDNRCEKYTAELFGIRYDGEEDSYIIKNVSEMMALELDGAKIHDIQFEDCNPKWDGGIIDTHYGTSLLARKSQNCTFSNITLNKVKVTGEGTFWDSASDGAILVCTDEGSTFENVVAMGCKLYCVCYAGTFVGEATGSTFKNCAVSLGCAVYADGSTINSYAGGLVGLANNCAFTRCSNFACVSGKEDCIGGITGKSVDTEFNLCVNMGSVRIDGCTGIEQLSTVSDGIIQSLPDTLCPDELKRMAEKEGSQENIGVMKDFMNDVTFSAYKQAYFKLIGKDMSWKAAYENFIADHNLVNMYHESYEYNWEKYAAEMEEYFPDREIVPKKSFDEYLNEYLTHQHPWHPTEEEATLIRNHLNESFLDSPIATYIMAGVAVAMNVYQIGKIVYDAQNSDNVGGIVGYMEGGKAQQCSNYGTIYSDDAYGGGIVGECLKGTSDPLIENCMNQACVRGFEQTGGIVGRLEAGAVKTCLNLGNVSKGNSEKRTFGPIYGQLDSGVQSQNNFYVGQTLGDEKSDCRTISLKMLASGEAAQLLNEKAGVNVWRQTIGVDYYPSLMPACDSVTADKINTSINPTVYTSSTSGLLKAFMAQYSDIVLTGDIDLNTTSFDMSSRFMPFMGTLDGRNHRLKNVYFNAPNHSYNVGQNDNNNTNVGFLSFAKNATFKDLELNDFAVYSAGGRVDTTGLLVANSYRCTYDNVRVTGKSEINATNKALCECGGLVGYSEEDAFINCWTGPHCIINGMNSVVDDDVYAGGLVALAKNSTFTGCYNQATVTSNDDHAAGIVSHMNGGSITSCLNMGNVTGIQYVGGIAGYACDANIKYCVNTATIKNLHDGLTGKEGEIGGIVGTFAQDNATNNTLSECANWGAVENAWSTDQCIYGETDGDPLIGNNYYACEMNGGYKWNVSVDYNPSSTGGGKWTENYNYVNEKDIFYQDIDNNTFPTKMPVPIPAAGKVYKNIHCDGSAYYSNIYSNTAAHEATPNKFNMCSVCGVKLENKAPAEVTITNADEMVDFRYAVNKTQDFTESTVSLANDIDLAGKTFGPIGRYGYPFQLGTFNGNYHHIKNLYVETTDGYAGLFGYVTGNSMMIENVIIDPTCVVRTSGIAVAGLVGCVDTANGDQASLTISHCGNEASVTGTTNVAGILGSVYTNDDMVLNIENCYNTGTIKGDKESAAICGYGRDHATVTHTWNSGRVTGYDEGYPFLRYNTSKTLTTESCYDVNGQTSNSVPTFKTADLESGRLTYLLNSSKDGVNSGNTYLTWCQKIGTDSHPVIKYSSDSRVYHHDYSYCDAPTVVETLFNNSDDAVATIWHDYDEDGICTRKAGEVHGEPIQATDNVWHVTRPGDLYYIAQEVNKGNTQYDIELMNDITDNSLVQLLGYLNPYYSSFHKWTPIGTTSHPFTKSFTGNYHTISGLYCDQGIDGGSSQEPVGLFGALQDNPSVANVSVQDCYFRSYWKAGLLAGSVMNSANSPVIRNIYTVGTVIGVTGLGGMIGYIQDKDFNAGSMSNCWTMALIIREKDPSLGLYDGVNNGAIVGTIRTDATTQYTDNLTNCFYYKGTTSFTSKYGTEKDSYSFASGDVCHLLNTVDGSELSTPVWGQNLGTESAPVFASAGIRHERSMSSIWGTVVLPYALSSNDAVQLYQVESCDVSSTEGTLTLKPVATVAANTPCFFKKLDGDATSVCFSKGSNTFTLTSGEPESIVVATGVEGWSMVGRYDKLTELTDVYYVAQNQLWYAEDPITIPAYRAYLTYTDPGNLCKSLSLQVLDEEGDVDEIVNINADGDEGPLYNLAGQRVSNTAKGIVIKNGVKYLRK